MSDKLRRMIEEAAEQARREIREPSRGNSERNMPVLTLGDSLDSLEAARRAAA